MRKIWIVLFVLLGGAVYAAQTSTHSFTNDGRGAHPGTLTYSGGVITVDMSALPDGVQVYRAMLVHDRGGSSGSYPGSGRATQPLQVEASDDTGNWLQTVPPRHYHLDCTEATQRAVSSSPKTLTLNIVSFAQLGSSPYIRVDVWCDQASVNSIPALTGFTQKHRDGDTMVTWTEDPALITDPNATIAVYKTAQTAIDDPDILRYRIYRHTQPIDATTIRDAELVDEIKPLSCWNPYYYGTGWSSKDTDPCPRLPVDDEVLASPDEGIYVSRTQTAGSYYYAVSAVVNGEEDLSAWTAGQDCSAAPVTESLGTGMVLLREKILDTDFMYVSNADRYYYVRWDCPPYYNVPSHAFDYLVGVPDDAVDPRPVDIALHCWGGSLNSGYGWWYEAENGALILATNMKPYDWWTAFHDNYGTIRPMTDVEGNAGGKVRNYAQKRVLSFLNDFVKNNWNVDDNRILVTGSSMGGSGCLMWGSRQADVFAYSNGWVGVYVPRESPTFFGSFEGVYGQDTWDCEYESTGMEAFDYWDTAAYILADPGREIPFLCTANGKNDGGIGWPQARKTILALQTTRQPHKFVWGQSGHSQRAVLPGESPSDRYVGVTIAKNQSVPAFSNCSQDNEIGFFSEARVYGADGVPFSYTIPTMGSGPFTFAASGLPAWASLDTNTGVISGTPSTGTSYVGMTATNAAGSDWDAILLTIPSSAPTPTVPSIISDPSVSVNVNESFVYSVYANGSAPIVYGATGVPSWASFDAATGTISGVPDAAGTYTIQFTATNGEGADSLDLTISTGPSIVSDLAASGIVGTPFNHTVQAEGPAPLNYTALNLPSWASFDFATHTISGTPDAVGATTAMLIVTNGHGSDAEDFVIDVTNAAAAPSIVSPLAVDGSEGIEFSYAIQATGEPSITYGASNLPGWASFSAANHTISGVPSGTGDYTIQLSATNGQGADNQDLVVSIGPAAPVVLPDSGIDVGHLNRYLLWQTGDIVDVEGQWEMTVYLIGASPDATATVNLTPRRCQFFTPPTSTVCTWTNTQVDASTIIQSGNATTDSNGRTTIEGVIVTKGRNRIAITHAITPVAPDIVSELSVQATVGQPFSYTILATGTQPIDYDASNLPAWASYDDPSHTISGTPDAVGTPNVDLTAANGYGTDNEVLVINVTAAPDIDPPVLSVTGFVLNGTAWDAAGTVTVTVAGTPVAVISDQWQSGDLLLAESPVTIVAEDEATNQTTVTVDVTVP